MDMVVIQPYISVSMLKKIKTKYLRCNGYKKKPYKARPAGGSDMRVYDGSDLKTYLLMRW